MPGFKIPEKGLSEFFSADPGSRRHAAGIHQLRSPERCWRSSRHKPFPKKRRIQQIEKTHRSEGKKTIREEESGCRLKLNIHFSI